MRAAILIAMTAGSCAVAAAGSRDSPPPKPSPLVGEWRVVSQTTQGRTVPWDYGDRGFAFTADGRFAEYGHAARRRPTGSPTRRTTRPTRRPWTSSTRPAPSRGCIEWTATL
jgi:hypothetical protein